MIMYNPEFSQIKVVSSLPGRIRVNIRGLLRNEKMEFSIRYELNKITSILSSHVSKNTGNILIHYNNIGISEDNVLIIIKKAISSNKEIIIPENVDRRNLLELIIDAMSPLYLFRKKRLKEVYENEYSISSKMIKFSISLSSIIFLFTFNIGSAVSALILGYPGILFAISTASYYYASVKLKMINIYLKSSNLLSHLNDIDTLLIEKDVFQNRFHSVNNLNLSKYDIQKLVILEKVDNPLNCNIRLLINNMRLLGVNDIFIIGNRENGTMQYISYLLGVEILDINNLEKTQDCSIKNKSNNTVLITTDKVLENQLIYSNSNLIICLNRSEGLNILRADINIEYSNINKLPLLIELSHFCREINAQTENIAITLNVLEVLFIILKYLPPLNSIFFYILNTFIMTLILKLRFKRLSLSVSTNE